MYLKYSFWWLLASFFAFPLATQAQLRVFPILEKQPHRTQSTGRIEMDTVHVELPFFDDFSSYTGQPDSNLWQQQGGVYISPNQAIKPPSVHVAIFDGVDYSGTPYNLDFPTSEGIGDNLTSHFLDFSEQTFLTQPYLSFYWKAQALGEKPDSTDFLRVQFKDGRDRWETYWEVRGTEAPLDSFSHQILEVSDNQGLFHPNFQFRFQSSGRLSGAFDSWVIDYVFMDVRDPSIPDRLDIACSEVPESFIAPYNAMPIEHYANDTLRYTQDSIYATVNNLHSSFNIFSYDCVLEDATTGEEIALLQVDSLRTLKSVLVQAREEQFEMAAAPNASVIPLFNDEGSIKDSLILNHTFRLRTGNPSDEVASNDTISRTTYLHDYYAYDDGTAEFAAGINQQFGKLAYRYFINEPALLTDLDIYFPPIIDDLTGQTFKILVWKKLDFAQSDPQDEVLLEQEVAFEYTENINQVRRIRINRPIEVSDSIFIGFQQLNDEILAVGLDKNTDSKAHLFFNVANRWEQNTDLEGSLMMRPVFRKEVVLGIEEDEPFFQEEITLYPNPAKEVVFIKGNASQAILYDMQGRLLQNVSFDKNQQDKQLTISNLPKGMYLVSLLTQTGKVVKKLMVY